MSESTPPPESSEPATGPVMAPPPPSGPPQPPVYRDPVSPQYVPAPESNRLNKAAAWVGVVAGSVIIVAVIFGSGFLVGKEVGEAGSGDYNGHHMMLRPAGPMFPMGSQQDFQRGPGFPGPFGPGGAVIEIPRPGGPDGPSPSPGRPGN